MDRVARRSPLVRAPVALKSHNAEKLKGGTLCGFSTSILSQNMKTLKKFFFGKKSHSAEKNWKEEPFGIFQHPFCRKTSKKCRGDPLRKKSSEKNVSQCRKKLKGGTLCSRPVWYVTRKSRKNLFGSVR